MCDREVHQSRKLKSRYRARNRFEEPSLEWSSQASDACIPLKDILIVKRCEDNNNSGFISIISIMMICLRKPMTG